MNLQVCAPHQECVYNCPFCVARGHKHKYHFKDIYKDGLNQDYFNALKRTIKTCNIDTVIITGECDPTQNMRWARKVAEVAKSCGVRTEIQTHNLSIKDVRRLLSLPTVSVPQWISVKERLPKVETEVLVTCNRNGYRFVCPAIYEDGTVLTQESIWNWYDLDDYGTYSEEDDDYFVPQGWWENRQFTPDDVYNSPVDCAVTDWMPLPNLPKR